MWFWRGNSFTSCPYFRETENRQARVQVCALALVFYLWDKPHYRDSSFSADLRQNLKNVAVPGTGLPLSFFCFFKPLGIFLVFILNPFFCFMGAINVARKQRTGTFFESLSAAYRRHLFFPDDWFSYWRLNCALASWYWLVTKVQRNDTISHLFISAFYGHVNSYRKAAMIWRISGPFCNELEKK